MKYFEFTFHTSPCTETVNDVLAAVLGEAGFESFVESEGGLTAYIQQALCDENTIKNAITEFPLPDTEITYTYVEAEDKDWNEEWEKNFLKPSEMINIQVFDGEILGVILPDKVSLKITECEQAVKGDTATSAQKNAVVETGLQVKVPLFIQEGETIVVSTADGKYCSRAKD